MWWWFRICNENHSLSFTFSILFSIEIHHFHQVSPFCHFHSCGWSICARLTKPQLTLCDNRDSSPSLSSCDIARPVDKLKRGRLRYVNPTLCPTLCQLFAGCSCAPAHTQHPPAAGHISWSPCGSHATHTIHSHVSSAHSRICSTLALCSQAQPLLQRNSLCQFTSLLPMRSNLLATNPVSLRSCYHATIMTFLCSQWRTLKAHASLSFALPPFAHVRITIASHSHCLLTHSLLCAMSRAAIASRIASAELCQSASAHRFCVVLHAHIYCFAFRELLLLLVAQPELHLTALQLSLSDVRVRGRCYFFWRSRRATFVRAQNCVATSCCR